MKDAANKVKHIHQSKYLTIFCLSLFPFLGFWQMSLMGLLGTEVAKTLSITLREANRLSAVYTYADALFLLPAGILMDRIGLRRSITLGLSFFSVGSLLFSIADHYLIAVLGRATSGAGHAFALLSCFSIVRALIPPKDQTFWISLTISIALTGGVMAQAPTHWILQKYSWQELSCGFFIVSIILSVLLIPLLPNAQEKTKPYKLDLCNNLKNCARRYGNWGWSFFTFIMDIPIVVVGAVLGVQFLTIEKGYDPSLASLCLSMIYAGTLLGTPVLGYLLGRVDQKSKYKIIITAGSIASTALFLICFLDTPKWVMILFFILGFLSSIQAVGYAAVSHINPKPIVNTAMSFVNVLIMAGIGSMQFIYGSLQADLNILFLTLAGLMLLASCLGGWLSSGSSATVKLLNSS